MSRFRDNFKSQRNGIHWCVWLLIGVLNKRKVSSMHSRFREHRMIFKRSRSQLQSKV